MWRDPFRLLSYFVSRPVGLSPGDSHGFVVTHADFGGDPDAQGYSC
jgi:hypothetical protein